MRQIIQLSILLILLSGCINDKKETPQDNAIENMSSLMPSDTKDSSNEDNNLESRSQEKPKSVLEKKEEKAIVKKVENNQKEFEEEQKKKTEEKRKASKYKNESCDKLIQKIEKAVAKAISNPDDEENLKFLYEINNDQTHGDCKKSKEYNDKFQDLMTKWDES